MDTIVKDRIIVIKELIGGEWVNADAVCAVLNISFDEGFRIFEVIRCTGWWSIEGKTPEERARKGQKITYYFRINRESV